MKHIIQKNGSDCGIASLAMLYGTSYSAMRRVVTKELGVPVGEAGMSEKDFRRAGVAMGDPLVRWACGPKTRDRTIARVYGVPAILILPALGTDPDPRWVHACGWDGWRLLDPGWGIQYPKDTNLHSAGLLHAWVRRSTVR